MQGARYNPYDLAVVPKARVDKNHCVMSNNGAMLVREGQPTEFVPLAVWQREKTFFDHLIRIPFFRHYLVRKVYRCSSCVCV